MPKPIPTEAEIDAAWDEANRLIDTLTMVPEFIIEDYPIGGEYRGRCRLAVDFKRGKGWRTNKTTTDRQGRWCKPKGSTYQDSPIVVVTGVPWKDGTTTAAWLKMDQRIGPYLQMANWDNRMLCEPPCYFRPARDDTGYSVSVNGGPASQKVLKGDDPLLCDAWERWFDEYKRLVQKVIAFIEWSK